MIFCDLPSPAEASSQTKNRAKGFAQAGNRFPFFGIMRRGKIKTPPNGAGPVDLRVSQMRLAHAQCSRPRGTAAGGRRTAQCADRKHGALIIQRGAAVKHRYGG
jgi:hypothetical protein